LVHAPPRMGSVDSPSDNTAPEQPPPPGAGNINWNFGLTQRPNGQHWILIQLITELNQYAFALPVEAVVGLIEQFPKVLGQLVTQANTLNGGLTVAGPDALKNLKGLIK
jgi:hypothetical protein